MNKTTRLPIWLAAAIFVASTATAGIPAAGDIAPDFTLLGSDGKTYTLADFKGERGVVLAWFPKAFTGGCTKELAALRDSAAELATFDAAVFMVSLDTPDENRAFAESLGAPQVLLSDATGLTASAYGVMADSGKYAKRVTFYIDREGLVRFVDSKVDVTSAGSAIGQRLESLGFPRATAPPAPLAPAP
jgi:peroxiredoxin Q/BCP